MIVKNESKLILRCLQSVREIIDTWVIVDTGSTDGTQEIIRAYFQDLPGELYERPWVNFGHNRNEALEFARNKADYTLFIDADEKLLVESFDKSALELDGYTIRLQADQGASCRFFLLNNHPGWAWIGVLHECIKNPKPVKTAILDGISIDCRRVEGQHPKTKEKYLQDAKILEKALENEPDNGRTVYFLAQSYGCAGDFSSALKYYQKRARMGIGWEPDAVFWSYYLSGCIQEDLKMAPEEFLKNYESAYRIDPSRVEPLYRMAHYYFRSGQPFLSYLLARAGLSLSAPKVFVALQEWIYDFGLLSVFAQCASALGKQEEAQGAIKKLLSKDSLPDDLRADFFEWAVLNDVTI